MMSKIEVNTHKKVLNCLKSLTHAWKTTTKIMLKKNMKFIFMKNLCMIKWEFDSQFCQKVSLGIFLPS